MGRPTVITGVGVAAPTGVGAEAHWANLLDSKSGITRISRFDASGYHVQLAGEVHDFDASDHIPRRLVAETDHMTHLAFAATQEALDGAQLNSAEHSDLELSVVTANSSAGAAFGQRELEKLYSEGPGAVGAYMSIAWFYAATTGQLSIRHGLRGPCGVIATEQAGGLDALGHSRRALDKGARAVVVGGSDAALTPYGVVAQYANGNLTSCTDPGRAYLPFDRAASGYVAGEGGAMVIVEDTASATGRGAPILGELAGYAATFDPHPRTGRPSTLRRAAQLALDDAQLGADQIDVVFADGYGTSAMDTVEVETIAALFGRRAVPVTVPKTATGRLYAGGAALDVVTALLCMRDGLIPPSINITDPAFDDQLDLVIGAPRDAPVRTALVLARGYGGFNSAVVLRRPDSLHQ